MTTRHVLAASIFLALACGRAHADQTDPSLVQLFADLKTADGVEAANPIEAQIWAAWTQSRDPAIDAEVATGIGLLGAGDYPGALQVCDQVVAQSPNYAEGWNKRATTLYLLGRFADSKADIARVLALEPRHFGALSGLSMCELQLNRIREALDALQRAQAIDPNLPGVAANVERLKSKLARESI